MEQKQTLLHLFTLLFCLSCILSLDAVPLPRTLALTNIEPQVLGVADKVITREEVFGRMDIESNDYPVPGANHGHDPRPPGRA